MNGEKTLEKVEPRWVERRVEKGVGGKEKKHVFVKVVRAVLLLGAIRL